MARKQYGTTWWGQQWLNALDDIDYTNRLPRGKTYANKGAVRDIEIKGNKIAAKVQGTQRTPYKVNFSIPIFTGSERAKLLGLVTDNPLMLSQLLNRELPPSLYKEAYLNRISLFPNSWRDLNGSCSCPDWAVPCKHMAAVLYLVANEIDKNPFLVFELHDFDIIKGLEGIGFAVADEQEAMITTFDALTKPFNMAEETFEWDELTFKDLDFTKIPPLKDNLLTILSEQPVFYPKGKFKTVLHKAYTNVARQVSKLKKNKEIHTLSPEMQATEEVEIIVDKWLDFVVANMRGTSGKKVLEFKDIHDFIDWLNTIPPNQLEPCSPMLRSVYVANQYARHLAEHAAFIPQLLQMGDDYMIRWIPAHLNKNIRTLSDQVEKLLPPQLLFYKNGKEITEPTDHDRLPALLATFLNHYVHEYNNLGYQYREDDVAQLFFAGMPEQFNHFEDREYPHAIQQWLSRFYMAQKDCVPVLQIEDADGKFELKIGVNDKTNPLQPPIPLELVFSEPMYKKMRMSVLRDLAMLIDYFPKLDRILSTQGKARLYFDAIDFVNVLFKILPTIRLFGIEVLLPKALRKLLRPQLSLSLEGEDDGALDKKTSIVGLDQMLSFQWQIALGDRLLSKEDFYTMINQFKGIVKINDEYVYFNEKEISKLLQQLNNPPELNHHQVFQVAVTKEYNGAAISLDPNAQRLIDKFLNGEETDLPDHLLATLRPYQKRGYEWMYKNARLGLGSIIADDMGLGKTIQVITTLLRLKQDGELGHHKGLIIVPTTLLTNWSKEIQRFAPDLKAHIYHGTNRTITPLYNADVLITTYGVVRSETAQLQKHKWLTVVIDEAQNIKNPATAQAKAIKKMKAPIRIAMSGTPVENRLSEYWSIFDFVNKGYLGSLNKFKDLYARPIELDRDKEKLDHFLKITAPFIMRRLKTDKTIISDLPDKIEKDDYCILTKEQAAIYQNVIDTTMAKIENSEGIERRGLVLKLITALKQVCNHPRQFLKKGSDSVVLSGKAMFLIDLVEQILDRNEKILIFTQYREMGNMLCKMLDEEFGLATPFLHGGVPRKQRDEMVEQFQNDRTTKIFMLSLKAAGTGLNLTAANNVIHYDLWWNPAVEAQATDRAYRIGQKQKVMVHRFITQGTFEEKINKMIQSKKELADMTVSTGEKWIGDLSNKDLIELVTLGGE